MIETLFGNLLTLLLVMAAGTALTRLGFVDNEMRKGLSRLLYNFILPAMVFTSMRTSITSDMLRTSYVPVLFGATLALLNGGTAVLLTRVFRLPAAERRLFAFLSMFSNNIYLGLPLALALFGPEAVAIVLLYSMGSDIILWSLGMSLLAPTTDLSWRNLKHMANPTFIALLVGMGWGVLQIPLFVPLGDAISTLGSIGSPLALLLTGAALADIKLQRGTIGPQVPALFISKLVVPPLLAIGAVSWLGLEATLASLLVILAGLPTFARSIILTDRYGWDGQKTALGVLATTLGCFVTIPLLLQLL